MKDVSVGKIYDFGGIHHLLLLEKDDTKDRRMYWCSLDNQGDIENLVDASNYCLVTPNKNWRYVGTISNEQYAQAVANFKAQVEKTKNGYRPNPNKIKK